MPEKVEVVLTFDDGPTTKEEASQNPTEMVMKALDDKGITGVFFIQSHVRDKDGNKYRGSHPTGKRIIEDMIADKHIVGIHTGVDGKDAHELVNSHRNRHPKDLEEDMKRARKLIEDAGGTAEFVRAPFGQVDKEAIEVYTKLGLEYVGWDLEPEARRVNGRAVFAKTGDDVQTNIKEQLKNRLKGKEGKPHQIVVLLHDIQGRVAYHIESHIKTIEETIKELGFTPDMHPSKPRMKQILRAQSPKNYLGTLTEN